MAVYTVSISDGTTLSNLAVSAGRGPKGDGFTGGTYNASTGIVTFTSNDGIGFSTDDLRGNLSEPGPIGDVTPNTGAFTTLSSTGDTVIGGNLTVEGTTTTVDSTTVAIADKNVEIAKDATTAAEADGGGITLNGAAATITYSSGNDHWALNKGLNVSGNVSLSGTVDGRDVAADGSKLDGIESGATADQTAGEIKTAYESNADTNAFTDAEQSKLSGIESGADVTDTANVTAAGALMDSELTSEASVKALDQGVATTDSPEFAGLSVDTNTLYVDSANNRVGIGTSSPSEALELGDGNSLLIGVNTVADTTDLILSANAAIGAGDSLTYLSGDGHRFRVGATDHKAGTSTGSEAMRINSSGNVGIGMSSPSEALDVDGNAKVSGLIEQNGSQVYSRDNIVGTVSQSGGTPTGAVIERSSNANGEYVLFADGTQICTHELDATFSSLAELSVNWTFPAAFSAAPAVSNSRGPTGSATPIQTEVQGAARVQSVTSTSVDLRLSRISGATNFQPGDSITLYVMAIGRWF